MTMPPAHGAVPVHASHAQMAAGGGAAPPQSQNAPTPPAHVIGAQTPFFSNSLAIRQEIQRFESVHPSIYAIYDLIEAIPDPLIQQQIRSHVVCIEDSFVNSQEWTISRSVPELRLGILGSLQSGKSALVHRYLTGSYMHEESPEGGRFKKEVVVDGQSFLLLIRDEGGPPEAQFTQWVDAVIFVFSLENESSFQMVYSYYAQMARCRNMAEIPLILVGTQDAISETSPRMIDDVRARKLAADLKQCSYYETCATYGLNVERVFQEACLQITQSTRFVSSLPHLAALNCRPNTPSHSVRSSGGSYGNYYQVTPLTIPPPPLHSSSSSCALGANPPPGGGAAVAAHQDPLHASSHSSGGSGGSASQLLSLTPPNSTLCMSTGHSSSPHPSPGPQQMMGHHNNHHHPHHAAMQPGMSMTLGGHMNHNNASTPFKEPGMPPSAAQNSQGHYMTAYEGGSGGQGFNANAKHHSLHRRTAGERVSDITRLLQESEDRLTSTPTPAFPPVTSANDSKDLPTPCSTPTQSRKNKRKSNLFTPNKKDSDKTKDKASTSAEEFGSGRAIPIKQGFLYKKSQKALSREWKKKYCTLSEGKLIYHPSLHDYMDDLHGKSIPLSKTTVKIPGQPPRGASSLNQTNSFSISQDMAALAIDNGAAQASTRNGDADNLRSASASSNLDDSRQPPDDNSGFLNSGTPATKAETPLVKKRQTKKKKNDSASKKDGKSGGSGAGEDGDESDGYEFVIVSYDNKTWHFEASSSDERREWVQAIEQTIHNALQGVESSKSKSRSNTLVDAATISSIRQVNGNQQCVDCGAPNPDWASLNLGALMCIECSGVHRNLGTHLSRVRSLDLDEWPAELSLVMTSIGNQLTNSIWEGGLSSSSPSTSSSSPRSRASKPRPESTREEKEAWIRAKYENKEFLAPLPPSTGAGGDASTASTLGKQLIEAITRDDLSLIILLLAHSKLTDVNSTYSTIDRRTPLHFSAALGSSVVLQLLLWHGADVNKFDHEARSALYFARKVQAADCVRILQNSGCPENAGEGVNAGSSSHPLPGGPAALMASVMVSSLSNAQHHQQPQSTTNGGGGGGGTLTRHLIPGHQTQKVGQNNSDVFDKLPASVI